MLFHFRPLALFVVLMLAFCIQPARADWIAVSVTPKHAASGSRLITVTMKDMALKGGGHVKACEITIAPNPKEDAEPIRDFSHGSLYLYPDKTLPTEFPSERGAAVHMTETRVKGKVICRFQVSEEQLPKLRFEFCDNQAQDEKTLGGGTIYWLNLRDFLPPRVRIRVR